MDRVADRLGVAKTVLYGYVGSRNELVRLAAANASQRHLFPDDQGQPWADYVIAHARALFDLLTGDAQLLASYLSGGLGAAVRADRTEVWMKALIKRGFTGAEAIALERAIGFVVLGAAAAYTHAATTKADGAAHSTQARDVVRTRPTADLPLLRQHLDAFAQEPDETNWEFSLLLLLHGVARARRMLTPSEFQPASSLPPSPP